MHDELKKIRQVKTYSLTAWHVREIKKIGKLLGVTDAAVLRRAIEDLSAKIFNAQKEILP